MKTKQFLIVWPLLSILFAISLNADTAWDAVGNYNPIVPGYFADPTITKFGDTYFLYTTTDGTGAGEGWVQVWISRDMVNWVNYKMNWLNKSKNWAPDCVAKNGKYYLYYNFPCETYGYSGNTPVGPWTECATTPLIPNNYVPPIITLDFQTFQDDNGSTYGYFTTWAQNNDGGVGWVKINNDMFSFSAKGRIPYHRLQGIMEGPFMLKRNGKYYLMYSNGDCNTSSYNVQYSINTVGPTDTAAWVFGQNNPILSTNTPNKVDGPGHHSILQVGTNYYICYHRHDIWLSAGGEHRQTCLDPMTFTATDQINKVTPTHQGVGYLGTNQNTYPNLASGAAVTASSTEGTYYPRYVTDDNNATLWRASDETMDQWVKIDLGSTQRIKRTHLQFEYPAYVYQYLIQYSTDNSNWHIFSDKRMNQKPGCPMVDSNDVDVRYFTISVTNMESVINTGKKAAIFNFKAFGGVDTNFESLIKQYANADISPGLPPYTINTDVGFGGSISPASASLWANGSQTFTITPLSGYSVASVTVDGTNVGAVTTYTFTNVNENHKISVRFSSSGGSGSIPQTGQLIFACRADTLPLSGPTGNWPTYFPAGQSLTKMNNPTVKIIASHKFVNNTYTGSDGFVFGSSYSASIACTGAAIVVVASPVRTTTADAWNSVVDVFYDRLNLGIFNNTGIVYSRVNGTSMNSSYAIPEKQITILSMVVQSNGSYKVYANGTQIISNTATSQMTSLVPGVPGDYGRFINVGRNNPDGWSTFNGNIGDVFLYKTALSDAERQQLETNIANRLITGGVSATVPESRTAKVPASLVAQRNVPGGVEITIRRNVLHRIDIIALSGRIIQSFGGDRAATYVVSKTSVAPGVYLVRAKVGSRIQTSRIAVE